jgi:response regulator NasT
MNQRENIRVLIAEDDYLSGEMIKGMAQELAYTVVGIAVNGQQAVEMTQSIRPDVILMDIEMPNMSGLEAARQIQAQCPTTVVMLTAHESDELVSQASEAGVGAYLVKPPQAGEMKRAITIALARFDDMMALRESNRRLEETLAKLQETQETMLQQARLAAVGRLSVSIAHEFNNILGPVTLYTGMSLGTSELTPDDSI